VGAGLDGLTGLFHVLGKGADQLCLKVASALTLDYPLPENRARIHLVIR
jgi:hypothetical protein